MRLALFPLFVSLLFLSGASPEANRKWSGTWSTSYGELRLASVGRFVVGDYGDRGIFVGRAGGRGLMDLTGVFTNAGRVGEVEFSLDRETFSGTWRWKGETGDTAWNGRRTSAAPPELRNFSRDGRALRAIDNDRKFADGVYTSTHGEVRLFTEDLVLIGDYGERGVFGGVWDGNGYVGQFTNGDRAGWFKFEFLSRTGSFRSGRWGWNGSDEVGTWSLTKTGESALLTYLDPAPEASTSAPEAAPPRQVGVFLRHGRAFDLDKARTLVSMQEHVQWVSGDEATARRELAANQFTLHGDGFIDTEASGELSRLTTGRLRAYVAHRGSDLVIVFRGSGGSNGWQTAGNAITDLAIVKRTVDFIKDSALLNRTDDDRRNARVHSGFSKAYERLRPQIVSALEANSGKNVYVFGHSLGGAMATLCAVDIAINHQQHARSLTHIVSGSPRVGNGTFRSLFESAVPNNLRMSVGRDPVPRIPVGVPARLERFEARHYRHVGRLLPIGRSGRVLRADQITTRLERDLVDFGDHDNKVYLDAARAHLEIVERSGLFANVEALGDAERAEAEEHAESILAAPGSLFD